MVVGIHCDLCIDLAKPTPKLTHRQTIFFAVVPGVPVPRFARLPYRGCASGAAIAQSIRPLHSVRPDRNAKHEAEETLERPRKTRSGAGVLDLRELLLPESELRIAGTEGKHSVRQRAASLVARGDANQDCAVWPPFQAAAAGIDRRFVQYHDKGHVINADRCCRRDETLRLEGWFRQVQAGSAWRASRRRREVFNARGLY
ncbi:MAG TPA: hypothetical protein VHY91_22790 [Pirellulales bacterium]|jgi:hypothetical protein|nr:hypothetical protein [Pirellulales bacterium]